ncbi:MAG: glycosyltransferase [Cyanobacteria bacterium CRU_2_1]|nr:glycosyltransferase [Cyanobacteria bacterium CRU_2_1]
MSVIDETQPLVSILINNYNYAHYVGDAINSALAQAYSNVEVIVVDDGSTDNSRTVIASYSDRIISVFKENGGQASALNAGFVVSKGEIICLLDADDLFLPEKVSEVVDLFKSHPGIDWVFTESAPAESKDIVDIDLKVLFKQIFDKNPKSPPRKIDFRTNIRNAELPNFTPSTSNLCFSRSFSEKLFPLPEVRGTSGLAICDTYINLLAAGLGVGCVTVRNLGIFRFHQNNLYTTQEFDKKRKIRAEILITTAYWIRVRFPEFSKLSKRLFVRGFGTYLKSRSRNESCEEMKRDYLSKIAFQEKVEISLLTFYYLIKP